MKQLGFTLPQIRRVLEEEAGRSPTERWTHAILLQVETIGKEKKRLGLLERMLHTTLRTIELRNDVPTEELLLFIHALQSGQTGTALDSVKQANV
ncbi:hypothetical protein [Paenibacillus ehimensis]|uniref:Uncharacterized protein n=1 Tax=Paenibacillus ehimensis TaxID=79264 RepID=A0ABT8VKF8_9BACL|nr:hypothetical protein [Paenibacillus ehimensis]MDO3681476.1 hypothetical protein [Paenibacillus ehimensis]MEC0212034.1 hypothetical protein [Paenibacillus ehimensis]